MGCHTWKADNWAWTRFLPLIRVFVDEQNVSGDEEVLGVGVTMEGWLEVVLGGKRLVARSATSLLGGPTHVHLALVRGNTAVKVNIPLSKLIFCHLHKLLPDVHLTTLTRWIWITIPARC